MPSFQLSPYLLFVVPKLKQCIWRANKRLRRGVNSVGQTFPPCSALFSFTQSLKENSPAEMLSFFVVGIFHWSLLLSDISLKFKCFCWMYLFIGRLDVSSVGKGSIFTCKNRTFCFSLDFFIGIFSCWISFLNGYSLLDELFYRTNRSHCGLWEHFPW